jgi:hypothetical protein
LSTSENSGFGGARRWLGEEERIRKWKEGKRVKGRKGLGKVSISREGVEQTTKKTSTKLTPWPPKRLPCLRQRTRGPLALSSPNTVDANERVVSYTHSHPGNEKVCEGLAHLVDHHDGKQLAQHEKEEPVDVVLDVVANSGRESEEEDTTSDEEAGAEEEISKNLNRSQANEKEWTASTNRALPSAEGRVKGWTYPSIIKRPKDEDELRYDIDGDADEGEEEEDDEESDGVGVAEGGVFFKGGDGDEEGDAPYD